MSIWWTIPGFVALVGVLLLFGGVGRLLKAKFVSGGFRFLFGGFTLAGAAIIGLIGLNLQTYAQLSKEQLAGQLTLKKTGEYAYTASVDLADKGKLRGEPVDYQVTGEIVVAGGVVLTFKPWANVVGMDSIFKVETVTGSYFDADCRNRYPARVEATGEGPVKMLSELWKKPAVDVVHGSYSEQPMADGAVYELYATQDAFIMKPAASNKIAQDLQASWSTRPGAQCAPSTATTVATPAGEVQYAPAAPSPNAPPVSTAPATPAPAAPPAPTPPATPPT
jgi:hypothetical protein